MKIALHCRCDWTYLSKVDEIIVPWTDRGIISDFLDPETPQGKILTTQSIILQIPYNIEFTPEVMGELSTYNTLGQGRMIFCVENFGHFNYFIDKNFQYYYRYPITTYQDLRTLEELGVCYVRLGAPLFFQLGSIKTAIPIRVVANDATSGTDFIPKHGVYGTWIRPEDLEGYEPYVAAAEFNVNHKQPEREQALYRIYFDDKEWPGELTDIFENFNVNCKNSMMPNMTEYRLNCNHLCQRTGACDVCGRAISLANVDLINEYRSAIEEN